MTAKPAETIPAESGQFRRHTDPPALWVTVLAGSITLHLFLILLFRAFSGYVANLQQKATPIAVDIVDVTPDHTTPASKGTTITRRDRVSGTAVKATSSSTPRTSSSKASTTPAVPANSTTVLRASERAVPTTGQPQKPNSGKRPSVSPTQPPSQPSESNRSQLRSPTTSAPSTPQSLPSPTTPATPPASRPTQPSSSGSDSSSQTEPSSSSSSSQSGTPGERSPSSGQSGSSDLPTTSINRESVPAGFVASVANPSWPGGLNDPPAHLATLLPSSTSKSFVSDSSGCLLTPDSLHSFGQPVVLRLALDKQGNIFQQPIIQVSSGNDSYDSLAACAIRTWQFAPAYNVLAGGKKDYVSSNLDVQIVLTK